MTPIVFAITGASGAIYAVRLLQQLVLAGESIELIISPSGWSVLGQELGAQFRGPLQDFESVRNALLGFQCDGQFKSVDPQRWGPRIEPERFQQVKMNGYEDYFCKVASGSALTKGMVICPCSGATLAGIAHALGNNLIQRAADVHLKERRPLLLVPREMPLSTLQLENMHRVSQAGATVLPAMPGCITVSKG